MPCRLPVGKPKDYQHTKVWGITLIAMTIGCIFLTRCYCNGYAFGSNFFADPQNGIYHLDGWNEDCDEEDENAHTYYMKGYQLQKYIDEFGWKLCPSCENWTEDAEDEYESERWVHICGILLKNYCHCLSGITAIVYQA